MQVAPAELESIILSIDGVVDAAVAGISDEKYGEVPRAFVKVTPDSSLTSEFIKRFVAGKFVC